MTLNLARVRKCLKDCDLVGLFTQELGWDRHAGDLLVNVGHEEYPLSVIAEKRRMFAYECPARDGEGIPDYGTRRKIERQVARTVHEHLIVFTDADRSTQLWQWVKREPARPTACREHTYHISQPGDALIQKLAAIEFTLEEEEGLTVVDVAGRTRAAFDMDRVTRRFYDRFKTEHTAFLKFIKGISTEDNRQWYASLMLNRLMFVYFIQKKGFLDGDPDYLRNRLRMMRQLRGKDKFLSFYRHFLLRLFHEGLGSPNRNVELDELLGNVPFMNGGLFDVHELEEHNPDIAIADNAFEKLFDFFDAYSWHLDERPLRNDNEINPDVLGYIFEKYVNQKQMGAYYTKEDITDYIAKNTIIPCVFAKAQRDCPVGFESDSPVWALLSDDPDRYIYPAVRHGVLGEEGNVIPLPEAIASGVDDVSRRERWNEPAESPYALPTETWREHVARRTRCLEIRDKLAAGKVHEIDDLITLNLDICQFALDAIQNCEGPAVLRAFYYAIAGRMPEKSNQHFRPGISVLDPTCGSGAFLFAALNILEPLYDACLQRMQSFLEEEKPPTVPSIADEIKATIAAGESATVEFKSTARWDVHQKCPNKVMERVIVESVAAFLNTKGGTLLIGVEDNGVIFGLESDYRVWGKKGNRDLFENWLLTRLTDHFGKSSATLLAVDFGRIDGKEVCRVIVQPSPTAVYLKEGNTDRFWVRVGNSKRELSTSDAVKYIKQRFDDQPSPPPYVPLVAPATMVTGRVRHRQFQRILAQAADHPNQRYFILKSIIIGNLFGVDIMEEAVEICKLRLFLKLVAQVETANQIEPLPDIDFNIRAGNTLVGFTSLEDVERAMTRDLSGQKRLLTGDDRQALDDIRERAHVADRAYQLFRQQQTKLGGAVSYEDKQELRRRLTELSSELDAYLAHDYGVDPTKLKVYTSWKNSHQPFHWLAEFYGSMKEGGFDVVIGNPPYVEYSKVRRTYRIRKFATELCGNLYAMCTERSLEVLPNGGRFGFIVQAPIVSTQRMKNVRTVLRKNCDLLLCSTYDDRPSKLFDGMHHCRLAILLARVGRSARQCSIATTRYHKWYKEERAHVFPTVRYIFLPKNFCSDIIPKFRSQDEIEIYRIVRNMPRSLGEMFSSVETDHRIFYKITGVGHWFTFTLSPPKFWRDGREESSTRESSVSFSSPLHRDTAYCCLYSTLHYWLYQIRTNCRDFNPSDLGHLPIPESVFRGVGDFRTLSKKIMNRLMETSTVGSATYAVGGAVTYQRFTPKLDKEFFDKTDEILAREIGLSDRQLDFILNYDIKYRLGQDSEGST